MSSHVRVPFYRIIEEEVDKMPVITLFSGIFCGKEPVVRKLVAKTGYRLISDADIVSEASRSFGVHENKIGRAFSARTSVFNKFTHERERSIGYLRLTLARMLLDDNLLIEGFSGHLIPEEVSHVLRVCLIADRAFRVSLAGKEAGLSESEALKQVRRNDEDYAAWVLALFNRNDPWDSDLYDMILPTDKMGKEEIIALIQNNMEKDVVIATNRSKNAVKDFILASEVEAALVTEGHSAGVKAENGAVTLTINKHVLMLSRLEEELKSVASKVPGVESVETRVGPGFHKTDIYRKYDFETPSKVLLVDDEREFVQTLSERLLMRDMGSAVAYDGESALELIKEDEPDVMILDLRMPGIDGIEVLRRVKGSNPEIEVIILTGHGSEADEKLCMELGAFAYLQKPVDIDELSETIKGANEAIRLRKKSREDPSAKR